MVFFNSGILTRCPITRKRSREVMLDERARRHDLAKLRSFNPAF